MEQEPTDSIVNCSKNFKYFYLRIKKVEVTKLGDELLYYLM